MSKRSKSETLIQPIITEKSLKLVDELNQYTFEVSRGATKRDVKKAVEEKFKVNVEKVRIVRLKGKRVSWGRKRIKGRRKEKKKAVVSLKSTESIDLFKVK